MLHLKCGFFHDTTPYPNTKNVYLITVLHFDVQI